jgi:hypothetical protein
LPAGQEKQLSAAKAGVCGEGSCLWRGLVSVASLVAGRCRRLGLVGGEVGGGRQFWGRLLFGHRHGFFHDGLQG